MLPSSPRAAGSSRSASADRSCRARACSYGSCPAARSSCSPPTTSCSAGPAGRSTSDACSRPPRRTRGSSPAHAEQIGQRLAREGALGRFAVDFVVVRDGGGSWTPYAIELNLRKGGTTHPFLTLQFLTDGRYDPVTALFTTPRGREKHLVATDHLESPDLRGLVPSDLFDIVARHGLHFDQSRQEGIVFHMISCLTEHGRARHDLSGRHPRRGRPPLSRGRADPAGRGSLGSAGTTTTCLTECAVQAVWYVAYASNLALDRFRIYLCGGRPSGGLRDYAGCRDARDPARLVSLQVTGGLVFAGRSSVWGGGMAFLDRGTPGRIACRAYLISPEQFADVTAQEMRRPPGGEFARELEGLLTDVESLRTFGPGHYETVVRARAPSKVPRCSP